MRAQRIPFAPDHVDAVDGRGHLVIRGEEFHFVGARLAERRIDPGLLCHLDHARELSSRKRRVVQLLDAPRLAGILVHRLEASRLDGKQGSAVGLDVIRVAVAAVTVICDHKVRAEAADLSDDLAHGLVDRHHPEGVGKEVGGRAGHSRVAVAEELDLIHLEDATRLAQFAFADFGEVWARALLGHVRVDDGRELAIRTADDTRSHPAIRIRSESATHGDRLVITMRVHRHQAQLRISHHSSSIFTDRITSSLRIAATTSMPFTTWPNRLYDLVSLWRSSTVQMKNCEPLVCGPEFAMATAPASYSPWTGSSSKRYPGPPRPVPSGHPPWMTKSSTTRWKVRPS